MKTFATREKRSAPAVRKARPYVHHPMGPVQQAQRVEIHRILRSTGAQAKLTIGQPNDKYEQEADRVADQVMAMPEPKLQRQPEGEEEEELVQTKQADQQANSPDLLRQVKEEEELLQPKRDGGGAVKMNPDLEQKISSSRGDGRPLSEKSRTFFEPRMGLDLGNVQVHSGAQAADLTKRVNARAFTLGSDIYFGAAQFTPESFEGKKLLAHELTHVVQQTRSKSNTTGTEPTGILRQSAKQFPAQEAVNALKPNATRFDISDLSVDLIEGIMRAEAAVLTDRWISSTSFGETQGPGQLGEDEINSVDKTFVTATKQFAAKYPGPPGTWKEKTNDPNWAYFYTAAYYLIARNIALRKFQPSKSLMSQEKAPGTKISDKSMGIHEQGLVTYHGGFNRMAVYRRRIAGDIVPTLKTTKAEDDFRKRFGITAVFKRWQVTQPMVSEAIRAGLFMRNSDDHEKLPEMETYLQNVAGEFDFEFDISASREASRRFYVAQGTVKITVSAKFLGGSGAPASLYKYDIKLYSDPSGMFSESESAGLARFDVGSSQSYVWNNLAPGHYRFSVTKDIGPVLHGEGRVEFK